MQFKIITNEVLRECLSNLLMNNYNKSYQDFRKFVKLEILEISEKQFEEFKTRKISEDEIREIILKAKINVKGEVERIKSIWDEKEKDILKTMNKITGIGAETKEIICYIDPYQNGGYYGENNITVGTYKNPEDILFVTAHELFHIFYWRKVSELNLTKSIVGKEKFFEWQLAEAAVHLLTIEPKMRKFWKTIEIDPYPEIEETLSKIKKIWEDNSFNDFLKKSYELLRN